MSPILVRTALGAALIATAVALGGVWFATGGSAPLDADVFPERLGIRVELGKEKEIRTVELYPDLITPKHSVATHGDGSITNYWFRADSTLEKAITEGPAADDGTRARLRYAEIADDGVTFVLDIEYRPDGTTTKETRLAEENKLVRTYFHANGIERRAQIILRDKQGWKLSQEDLYREDHTLAESLRSFDNKAWEKKFYSEQGVLVGMKKAGPYGTSYTEVAYQEDGVTKKLELDQNSSRTILTSYRPNGSRIEERTYNGPVAAAPSTQVVYFDDKDQMLFQQWWSMSDGKQYLWLIKEFRADKSLARTIYFERNSQEATEIAYKGDGEYRSDYTRRRFDKEGRLTKEEDEVGNKVVATREFTPEENIRLDLPEGYTTLTEVATPPQVIEYSPPGMY